MEVSWGWLVSYNHFWFCFCVWNGHCLPTPGSGNIAMGEGSPGIIQPLGARGSSSFQWGVIDPTAAQHNWRLSCLVVFAFFFSPLGCFFPLAVCD